jgi:hypothetical protein
VDDARLRDPAATSHRWKIVEVDEEGHSVTLYVQDLIKVPGSSKLVPISSLVDAQLLVLKYQESPSSLGQCLAVQQVEMNLLLRHSTLLGDDDVRANSPSNAPGSLVRCCECGEIIGDEPSRRCGGPYPFAFGRISRCRRGVACSTCAEGWLEKGTYRDRYLRFFPEVGADDNDEQGAASPAAGSAYYICFYCRTPSPSQQDIWGYSIVPPIRIPGVAPPLTQVSTQPLLVMRNPSCELKAEVEVLRAVKARRLERVSEDRLNASAVFVQTVRASNMTAGQADAMTTTLADLHHRGLIDLKKNLCSTYKHVVTSAETLLGTTVETSVTKVYFDIAGMGQLQRTARLDAADLPVHIQDLLNDDSIPIQEWFFEIQPPEYEDATGKTLHGPETYQSRSFAEVCETRQGTAVVIFIIIW